MLQGLGFPRWQGREQAIALSIARHWYCVYIMLLLTRGWGYHVCYSLASNACRLSHVLAHEPLVEVGAQKILYFVLAYVYAWHKEELLGHLR